MYSYIAKEQNTIAYSNISRSKTDLGQYADNIASYAWTIKELDYKTFLCS